MGKTQKWEGVSGVYTVDYDEENPLRVLIPGIPVEGEVEMRFTSSGYYDPGCMYLRNGDPGYPPEGEDERMPDGNATISFKGEDGKAQTIELSKEQTDELFEMYDDEIQGVELDYSEPDYDDRDYDRDDYDRYDDRY